VKDGVMKTNAFVFDTEVVNVGGDGTINLQSEEMDLKLNPEPKDRSVASLNAPLYIRGSFGAPKFAPDWQRLGARGIGAVAMGLLNPFLAVLPLMKEGEDKDSPCQQLIAEATKATKESKARQEKATARAAVAAKETPSAAAGATREKEKAKEKKGAPEAATQ